MVLPLFNRGHSERIEKLAIAEFSGDLKHRLQHFRVDSAARRQPSTRQCLRLVNQFFLFAGAGHERNQLFAQQARVVGIARLCGPSQRYGSVAELLANKSSTFIAQIAGNAFPAKKGRNVRRRLHHVPVRIVAEFGHQGQRGLR